VQKLREGWDCPFAYVLCSLKETRSATAIEQIVGRILSVSPTPPGQAASGFEFARMRSRFRIRCRRFLNELREALESNGFTRAEAERIIIPVVAKVRCRWARSQDGAGVASGH